MDNDNARLPSSTWFISYQMLLLLGHGSNTLGKGRVLSIHRWMVVSIEISGKSTGGPNPRNGCFETLAQNEPLMKMIVLRASFVEFSDINPHTREASQS